MYEQPGDFMFQVIPMFIGVIFVLVFSLIIFTIFKSVSTWSHNNKQPRLTSKARVVAKRTRVHGGAQTNASSSYFVTFEFESGDRQEFHVNGHDFGQLAEGDKGELEFQGSRYIGFIREGFNSTFMNDE